MNELVSSNNSLSLNISGIRTDVTITAFEAKNQNEKLEELQDPYSGMTHKLSGLDEKTEDIKYQVRKIQADLPSKDQPDREIPLSNLFTRLVEGISSVYHSEKFEIKEKFPLHFPKERIEADYALVT